MKKILYIAAATILLAGCTKNEIVRTADNSQEISFSAYDSRVATKAANLTEGSFRVTATYKKGSAASSSYFTNEKYTWSTDKFVSAGETHYWPVDGGKLTFFATMPENNVTDATKKIVPDTTVTFHADGKTDFMAAYLAAQDGPSAQLAFNHKLTKVSFAAKGQDTGLKYVVKSITLTADSTATYTMGTTGSWGTASNSKDYAVLAADSTIVKGTTTYKSLGASQLVIPSSGDAVSLNVKYQVYDGDNLVDDYSASGVTVDLSSSAASWDINKSFVYNLTLGVSSSVSPITFNAEQTDWSSEMTVPDNFEPIREALKTAEASSSSKVVTLDKDYTGTLNEPIVIPSGVTLIVSGHSLTATNGTAATFISVPQGAKLIANTGDATRSTIIYHSSNNEASVITVERPSSAPVTMPGDYPIQLGVVTISSGASDKLIIKCNGSGSNLAIYSYVPKGSTSSDNLSYYIGKYSRESNNAFIRARFGGRVGVI